MRDFTAIKKIIFYYKLEMDMDSILYELEYVL